ncbi:MAG: hypothetical protein EAZ90_23615 [Oscillatoriales cyanobacterium]|nr:MAG: hypothetical protein EAZ90_23615 [Oscillatoriales cyanobacterium]TAE53233.1 MAG: hypothetical protein EAZ88_12600 [Oscillatoriales cyanobacterium]TAF91605.1 MAG: hypothetical protein EAZ49_05180 [Oscillatoriales cyanobacterium]TAG63679.1 MAG: hypothetical protein EAZ25_23645 [Oscillatoriales cyanobacterium]
MWAIYGIVCFLFLDYRSFFVWSIAHIVFLVAEEILNQREVGIGWVCAIDLGRSKFVINFQIQSKI